MEIYRFIFVVDEGKILCYDGKYKKRGGIYIQAYIFVFLLLLLASIHDLFFHKVPNYLILFGLLLSLFYGAFGGVTGLFLCLIGGLVPFFLCYSLYYFRMIGAGDVKLFSLIGSFYGVSFVLEVIMVSFFIGFFFSVIRLFQNGNILERFQYFSNYVSQVILTKKAGPYYNAEKDDKRNVIPFAICISLGTICCKSLGE